MSLKRYLFYYRGGEITAEVVAENSEDALDLLYDGKCYFYVNPDCLHLDYWEDIDSDSFENNNSIDEFQNSLVNLIRNELTEILSNNGFNENNLSYDFFNQKFNQNNIHISEYQIGRIYSFAEMYYKYTGNENPYNNIIDLISNNDLNNNKKYHEI